MPHDHDPVRLPLRPPLRGWAVLVLLVCGARAGLAQAADVANVRVAAAQSLANPLALVRVAERRAGGVALPVGSRSPLERAPTQPWHLTDSAPSHRTHRLRNAALGALIGTAVGAGVGAVTGAVEMAHSSDAIFPTQLYLGVIGAGAGLLLGTLVGALIPRIGRAPRA